MEELKEGDKFKMKFPFKKTVHKGRSGNSLFGPVDDVTFWQPGCWLHEEEDGSGYRMERYFYANAEGEVIYKILSIAKMPGKYMDRIIYKRWTIDPDGKKYNNGSINMTTVNGFNKDIGSVSPFRADYEIDESARN